MTNQPRKTLDNMTGDEIIESVKNWLDEMNKVTVKIPEAALVKLTLDAAKEAYKREREGK